MLFVKHLIYFLLIHLVIASPQINLHLTHWINENIDDIVLQHDCLHIASLIELPFSHQIISYCMSESPLKWNIQQNNLDPMFTFAELEKQNITSEQLYHWSTPIDIIEDYQFYLNQLSTSNYSSLATEIFYNCTMPKFGPQCQYSFDISASYYFSLNDLIDDYYHQSYEPKTLTCYTHLQCNRGLTLICLDWSEICDGKMDCTDGSDEENCWPLMNNKCEDDEYRCDNGQCIPETFSNDLNTFDCLDRSDEPRISLIPSRYQYSLPTFENEDVICSWRRERTSNSLEIDPFTSSCVSQRHSIIRQAVLSDKSNEISDDCLSAFKCRFNISTYDNPLCSDFCEDESCTEIMNNTCPDIFYYPSVPIAFSHIYFAYTKEYAVNWRSTRQIPPQYICYNEQLCGGFYSNITLLSINGNTCRRPEDFPVSFNANGNDWYLIYIQHVYSQLSHCNRIVYDNSVVCTSFTMYQCKNSSKCIPKSYVGDGIRDCDYNDDEEQTTIDLICLTAQSSMFFKCQTTNKCIHRKRIKDGICNCEIDEYDMCDDEHLKLNELRRKIMFSTICDGFVDLLPVTINGQNQTDETNCEQWPCNTSYTRCDGFWNCPNGADEIDCDRSPLIQCSPYHHICVSPATNELICLPIEKAFDGIIDCLGGIDEPTLCPVKNRFNKRNKFYCQNGASESCISSSYLCDEVLHCEYGDDENFCNDTLSIENIRQNFFISNSNNGFQSKLARALLKKSKPNLMISHSSIIKQSEQQYCHRGLPLRVWLDASNALSTITCLCPPSYYGDRCQYQNQRVSLTMQLNTTSNSQYTPFVLVISLIDDSIERIIHSYHQLTYFHMKDQQTKFNVYLLYSTRPKSSNKQYSVHIDIYERSTLSYRGSLLIPLKFPFLPVERIAIKLNIPDVNNIAKTCSDRQCVHGKCIQYLDDPKQTSFCQCNQGWTGQYCTIPHTCTCSPDSLCVGIAANNRSICVCPVNKFGLRCLLTNNVCQSAICQNGGICISSDEPSASRYPYVCLCRKGYSGERCEVRDTQMILLFHKDIVLPSRSFIFFHFIRLIGSTLRIQDTSRQIICENDTSVEVYWPHPFHTAIVELSAFQYYLAIHQTIYYPSSVIAGTINPLDRCRSINEIFNESMIRMHLIQRIKYYHLPCQNRSLNLSCFYDDVYMCVCHDYGAQRLANCSEFNHHMKIDDLPFGNKTIELVCSPGYSFNSSTSLSSPASSTRPIASGMSSIHACEYVLYLFMWLFCLYIHYAQ